MKMSLFDELGWVRMRRGVRRALCFAAVAGLIGCGESGTVSSEAEKPRVEVVTLEAQTISIERTWPGMIVSLNRLSVAAPGRGVITGLFVEDGDVVEKGDSILRIEDSEAEARRAVLGERRDALAEDLARWERLAGAQAAGPGEVEAARLRLLEVEEALAAHEARRRLGEITASAHGRVTGLAMAVGNRVGEGELLMRIEDSGAVGIRFVVPAVETKYFADRDRLDVVDAEGESILIKRLVSVEHETLSEYVTVNVWLDGTDIPFPGDAEVVYREEREAIVAPWTAVARDGEAHWVAVVTGDPTVIERRRVVLGSGRADGVEVRSGLEAGDRILRFEPRSQPEGREVAVVSRENPSS